MFKGIIRELKREDAKNVGGIFDLYWSGDFRQNLSKRLNEFVNQTPDSIRQGFKYFVAEENGEVVGVAAFRKLPDHMKQYAQTEKPAEFYVSAVKQKDEGIGTALRVARIEEAKKIGYTEVLFFSGETHKDSWDFHDEGFERAGIAIAPNGEAGYVWRTVLK